MTIPEVPIPDISRTSHNITLGYTIPKQKHLSNLRVYLDVNNPFIITPYEGIDPETDALDDGYSYPNTRTFSVGLSITF